MAGHLGTAVQLAAVGPQNVFLDMNPQVTAFYTKNQRSTRFASEAQEDLPLQSASFGANVVFEVSPSGDLLGDMHIQFRIPAVQPVLGADVDLEPLPATVEGAAQTGQVAWNGIALSLSGFENVTGQQRNMERGNGKTWVFENTAGRWEVAIYDSNRVVSCLVGPGPPRTLTVASQMASRSFVQRPNRAVAVVARNQDIVDRNDLWHGPLAYMLFRRIQFVVDDLIIHDQERLWYDLGDKLAQRQGCVAAARELLGSNLSMGAGHILMLPLKFMCCSFSQGPRAFFPTILLPRSRIKIEIHMEEFAACIPATPVLPATPPSSLDIRLVGERIYLDDEERNTLLLSQSTTIMYRDAQDMDALNHVENDAGDATARTRAVVDLSELNLPVTSLAWVAYAVAVPRPFEYLDVVKTATLQFGSVDRTTAHGAVFSRQQLHSHFPRGQAANVYAYSFALDAWGAQPSGSANFSLVQKPVLRLDLTPETQSMLLKIKVWGATLNWLTFRDGKVTRMFTS